MPWNSAIVDSEILAVHAALVPGGAQGEVVLFGGDEHWAAQQEPGGAFRKTRLYDVGNHALVGGAIPSPDSDVFCAHHAFAADGRLLIVGGTQKWPEGGDVHEHQLDFLGHRRCWLYNHRQRAWVETAPLTTSPDQPDEPHSGGRWYPGAVTLANGEVAAFMGHPDQQDARHRNARHERYNQGANQWIAAPKDMSTTGLPGTAGRRFLFFPRVYLLPNGNLYFATAMPANFTASDEGPHLSTAFDPFTADYLEPKIGEASGAYANWDRPGVLLPILPNDDYRVRMLFVGGVTPQRLDLGAASPAWSGTAPRDGSLSSRDRRYSNAVLLPTGDVCVVGGVHVSRPEDPVLEAEIYSPGINWDTGAYSSPDAWSAKEAAVHGRNYHSSALLLPNGKVWVAGGNTNANPGDPDSDVTVGGVTKKLGIKKIELYEPDYIAVPNRLQITSSPRVLTYDESFVVEVDRPATNVKYAALLRASSVTHSSDNDQRFVALVVESLSGNTLTLKSPPSGAIAPPGYYLLWLVDTNNAPCQLATFVRVAYVDCGVVTDRSTFSKEEVEALGGGGQATFNDTVFVHFDGFIHTELVGTPTFTVQWADSNATIPPEDFTLVAAGRLQEVNPGFEDIPQRITFPFHVRFHNLDTFATFTDTRQARVTFRLGSLSCSETLDLTYAPNPYMVDITLPENNPAWLSTDVRVFSIAAGQTKFGNVLQGLDDPIQFIRSCLDRLNNPSNNGNALFEGLSTSATLDLASTGGWPLGLPLYNYAISRVRYRATTTTAQRVKCFFRMFNVAATGLQFDPITTYRRTTVGPDTVPLVGTVGGEVASIPFFASERVETIQGATGATSMASQVLDPTYEIRAIPPNPVGTEVTAFFGCWLDINQTRKRFPADPGGSDGPWPEVSCRSIQELSRGRHMCAVAEVFFVPDLTQNGETPSTSDNLAQRNLAILHSDNPGGAASHTVMHTFEVKPSLGGVVEGVPQLLDGRHGALQGVEAIQGRRIQPDELIFRWHNLPPDTEVTVVFSDLDTADIQALGMPRRSPLAFQVVDRHTLRFKVAGATWMPIPGGRELNIPALLTMKLPDSVSYGQEYRVTVHQVTGWRRQIVGSAEFRIVVSKAELILDQEQRDLSVMKHILSTIPADNRWYPLWQRYVHQLGERVDALGGDADDIHPNPDGSGRPYDPTAEEPRPGGDPIRVCCEAMAGLACRCLSKLVGSVRAILKCPAGAPPDHRR